MIPPRPSLLSRLGSALLATCLAAPCAVAAERAPQLYSPDRELPSAPSSSPALAASSEAPSIRWPGEFERQSSLLLGCGELAVCFPKTLADIVEAARARVRITALIGDDNHRSLVEKALDERGIPADAVQFAKVPHNTMWIRDWGPLFVLGRRGNPIVIDAEYRRTDRASDESAPSDFARAMRLPAAQASLTVDGGNLLSNGEGVCVTTSVLLNRNVEMGRTPQQVERSLRGMFGAREVVVLEPLAGEPTGHVDMFTVFVGPQTVVVADYAEEDDPVNAAILDRNAERLSQVWTSRGPLQVVRTPMPSHEGGIWRTHTNVVFANGLLLMPVYADGESDVEREAMQTFARLLPGWQIQPIDVTELIRSGGALHCISMNAPAGR